ncbi:Fructose-2,6-bisphosphatase [Luteimonas sp. J16]|jgi:broad specificity phosphatase PhoE|nr:Fructose-2,6-bisphosphatase [Luteimonas sp. J16]
MPHNGGMHPIRLRAALLATLLPLAACAATPPPDDAAGATFVVVRHAEKDSAGGADPGLSEAGRARADRLADRMAAEPLVAAYATGYRRTQETIGPAARRHGLEPVAYDAHLAAGEFASRLRADHPRGTVLVAGHSNTVPEIVSALCACPAEPMDEDEYDRLSVVRVDAAGRASLQVARQDAAAP